MKSASYWDWGCGFILRRVSLVWESWLLNLREKEIWSYGFECYRNLRLAEKRKGASCKLYSGHGNCDCGHGQIDKFQKIKCIYIFDWKTDKSDFKMMSKMSNGAISCKNSSLCNQSRCQNCVLKCRWDFRVGGRLLGWQQPGINPCLPHDCIVMRTFGSVDLAWETSASQALCCYGVMARRSGLLSFLLAQTFEELFYFIWHFGFVCLVNNQQLWAHLVYDTSYDSRKTLYIPHMSLIVI